MAEDTATRSGTAIARGSEFHISELFFSRTDTRGVIASGNAVFQRISGFTYDELLNAPHKIVRHPDMPKAVFWLLWHRLQKGEPIGAYVKNRTKSGGYYWVFAVVMPITGGYLSVRLKPTSKLFERVQGLYKELRTKELEAPADYSPENSAQEMNAAIKALGYPNYVAFMAAGLTAELMSRDKIGAKPVDDRLQAFDAMSKAVGDIFDEANALYADFRRIEQIPVNLRLQASRCEASGGPVSVISANYSNLAREALAFASRFTDFGQRVLDEISLGLFMMGSARLQREMNRAFEAEDHGASPIDHQREMALLAGHMQRCGDMARSTVGRILEQCERFIDDSRRMRRFVGGLDVTRVTCRIETGWLPDADGGFHDIIDKLDAFHEDVERRMKRIDSLNDNIIERTNALLNRSASRKPAAAPKATAAE
ncbi:PAS domain-containing protein [Mangrovicoccus sp. HB161399]|uniref:PAS domain-containing protein n=1 Tax=Mangrovicoccus sp. HB161399 TaxID=2720392 RepID=UPI0015579E5D|nr:PAS domain-containing protein [Mangrovicoccus sp. HB161399]